jgi:hypothetical protein
LNEAVNEILLIKSNLKSKFDKIQSGVSGKPRRSSQSRSRSRKPRERKEQKVEEDDEKNGHQSVFSKD